MSRLCIITSHPFWNEPLGCGSLMRARYELLSKIDPSLRVIYITRSNEECPLPNSGTLKVQGPFTDEHVEVLTNFVLREKIGTCFFSYSIFDKLAARLPCRKAVEIHDVLHLRQKAYEDHGYEAPVKKEKAAELESLAHFDSVLCINRDEAQYLTELGVPGVHYLPPAMPFNPVPLPRGEISAGLIGSSAVPNVDGLKHAIAALQQLPHLVLAGSLSLNQVLNDIAGDNVERLGILPEVRSFYEKIHVALSPVRFGGGLKIKVLEALAHGRPLIATAHSVEGFPPGIEEVVLVEDDFSRWNEAMVRRAAATSASRISEYFRDNFSPERGVKLLSSIL